MSTADKLLSEMAAACPEISPTGDAMRARMAEHAARDLIQAVHLAHARSREAVVTGVRMGLQCGALLIKTGGDWDRLLRAAGISEQVASGYVALALAYPDLAATASKRFGRIGEGQALAALQRGPVAAPMADLRALCGILA